MLKEEFQSGFCTIIGPPNAGKSTLMNAILNYPLNIVSSKPQTTRNSVLGVYNENNLQIIFTDTPGILKKKSNSLDQELMKSIHKALDDSDFVLFLFDINDSWAEFDTLIAECALKKNILVVFNKIDEDRFQKQNTLECPYPHMFISAKEKENLNLLLNTIKPFMKDNIEYYPQDFLSNRTERFFVKEYIREALLNLLHQEIPHSLFVDIDDMDESDPTITKIKATIYTEREAHKKIIIGNKGTMIKQIGIMSREKIENLLDKKVFLEITVKVAKDWKNNAHFLKKLEYY